MEEFDVIVVGAGPGGYVAAIKSSQMGFKTACIEKDPYLGGTCLNVGCIPSKALLQSTELFYQMKEKGKEHGIESVSLSMNFSQLMKRKNGVVDGFRGGITALFKKNKVVSFTGEASFIDPYTLQVGVATQIKGKYIILATGSEPMPLAFLPFDEKKILSSTGALSLDFIPRSMILVGAGVIGVELGSVYQRLGTAVTCVEFLDRICPTMDMEISRSFQKILEKQGMKFILSTKVTEGNISQGVSLKATTPTGEQTFTADVALVAIGRRPAANSLKLDKIGILLEKGFIPVNDSFQTSQPHVFAIGDVIGGPMLAHKASEEAIAVVEMIKGSKTSIQYSAIASVVYTDPEVASVGFTEEELKAKNISYKKFNFPFKANSRAKAALHDEGFVKMIISDTHHLLGTHIIGPHAGELIQEVCFALHHHMKAEDIAATSHAHPTFSESLKEAALGCISYPIHY